MTTNEADIDFSYPRLTILLNDDKNSFDCADSLRDEYYRYTKHRGQKLSRESTSQRPGK